MQGFFVFGGLLGLLIMKNPQPYWLKQLSATASLQFGVAFTRQYADLRQSLSLRFAL